MSALDLTADANPQTQSGTGGAQPLTAPVLNEDFSQYAMPFDPMAYGAGPALMSAAPASATDAQYLQENAQQRADLARAYGAALQQLGYTDPTTGQFIPGALISAAQIKEAQDQTARQQAILQNTQNAQQNSILFSGMRGQMQAQAEQPFVSDIASIENQLPQDLANYLGQAKQAISDYAAQNNASLAAAAARAAAAATQNPITPAGGSSSSSSSSGGNTTTPSASDPYGLAGMTTASLGAQMDQLAGSPQPIYGPGSIIKPTAQQSSKNIYSLLPYQRGGQAAMAGGILMAGGGEVGQPTQAVIGEAGPESVVPRSGLTPPENDLLTGLRQTAQARLGQPGIHWFGPGGSGVAYPGDPNAGGPVRGIQPPPISPAAALQAQGQHDAAVNMWMQHHPGAMLGKARAMPNWVHAAVHEALDRIAQGV